MLWPTVVCRFDLSARRQISLTAFLNFSLVVTDLYIDRKDETSDDEIVMVFGNLSVFIPTKGGSDTEDFASRDVNTSVSVAPSVCHKTLWSTPGAASLGATPQLVFRDERISLFQSTSYADGVKYASFQRPRFSLTIDAYEQDTFTSGCVFQSGDDDSRGIGSFPDLECCYGEGYRCSVWIGQSGWIYWGTAAEPELYGALLAPAWNWYGTRRDLVVNASNYLDVRPVSVSSNFFPPTITLTKRPRLEFYSCRTDAGAVVRLYAGQDGSLQRYVRCATLSMASNTTIVVDFQSQFQGDTAAAALFNAASGTWDFAYNAIIVAEQTQTSPPVSTFTLAINNEPLGFVAERAAFSWEFSTRQLSVKFSLRDASRTAAPVTGAVSTSTTTPPPTPVPTPVPTPPPFSCQRNCNGHGLCIGENNCECFNGFVADGNVGCLSADLAQTTGPQTIGSTVTIKVDTGVAFSDTTAGRATEGTAGTITLIRAMTELGDTTGNVGTIGSTAPPLAPDSKAKVIDVLQDNIVPIAAGAAGGAALLCIGVIVCIVVRRKRQKRHTKLDETTSVPNARDSDDTPMKTYARNTEYRAFNSAAATKASTEQYAGAALNTSTSEVYTVPMGMTKGSGDDDVYHVPRMGHEASAGEYKAPALPGADDAYVVPNMPHDPAYQEFIAPSKLAPAKKSGIHEPAETADLTPYHEFDLDNKRFAKYED